MSHSKLKRYGGSMTLEFYAPEYCTKKCTLRKTTPTMSHVKHSFKSKELIENMVFMWSDRQLFSIDMILYELFIGPSYLRKRRTTNTHVQFPVYTKVKTSQIQLALRIASGSAQILSNRENKEPTNDEIKCSERWFEWTSCLNNVLKHIKHTKQSFVCVGFV